MELCPKRASVRLLAESCRLDYLDFSRKNNFEQVNRLKVLVNENMPPHALQRAAHKVVAGVFLHKPLPQQRTYDTS